MPIYSLVISFIIIIGSVDIKSTNQQIYLYIHTKLDRAVVLKICITVYGRGSTTDKGWELLD